MILVDCHIALTMLIFPKKRVFTPSKNMTPEKIATPIANVTPPYSRDYAHWM